MITYTLLVDMLNIDITISSLACETQAKGA